MINIVESTRDDGATLLSVQISSNLKLENLAGVERREVAELFLHAALLLLKTTPDEITVPSYSTVDLSLPRAACPEKPNLSLVE